RFLRRLWPSRRVKVVAESRKRRGTGSLVPVRGSNRPARARVPRRGGSGWWAEPLVALTGNGDGDRGRRRPFAGGPICDHRGPIGRWGLIAILLIARPGPGRRRMDIRLIAVRRVALQLI